MYRRKVLSTLLFSSAAARTWAASLLEPPSANTHDDALTVEEVVKLSKAGFAEEIIVTKIKKNGKAFDLSSDELIDLKKSGVSDTVVKYLLDPAQPYTPPAPPPVSSPKATKKYPEDAYASKVPAEPGLYIFAGPAAKIDLKLLLGKEEAKTMMKKGKATAYLIGEASRTRIKMTPQVFYARLPEGKEIEELMLLAFVAKNDRREIDLGAPGPKQQIRAEQIRPCDSLEVGARLYRLNPGKLIPGEYIFYFLGSSDAAKGVYGKGYDFGVDDVKPPR